MPRLSVIAIRLSLAYLFTGFTFGALMLANKGVPFWPALWVLLPSHYEILLLGWLVQLAMGMAFWILPRFAQGAARGNEKLFAAAVIVLNLGIWLVILGGWLSAPVLLVLGRAGEAAGAATFLLHAWPRVKAMGV
jgi:hypothetical protein